VVGADDVVVSSEFSTAGALGGTLASRSAGDGGGAPDERHEAAHRKGADLRARALLLDHDG
jgi:hypothetical protein